MAWLALRAEPVGARGLGPVGARREKPTRERRPPGTREAAAPERGNILVLGLGLWLVACLLLFGTISVTLVALERRELFAQADTMALEIADDLDEAAYYGGASADSFATDSFRANTHASTGGSDFAPSSVQVQRRARELLGPQVRLAEPTGVDNGAVVVTLAKDVSIAFLPSGSGISGITIDVTSRAQLRTR